VYNVVFWLKSFQHKDSVLATISQRTIIKGLAIDYHKHFKIAFGTYVEVHEEEAIEHEEDMYGERVTLHDINIITEMNTSQLAIQQQRNRKTP